MLLEPEKDEIVRDVVSWMDGQLSLRETGKGKATIIEQRRTGSERGASVGRGLVQPC